jgi:hypothetical protein
MKILLKVVGAVVLCVVLALMILSITGLDAKQRRAGPAMAQGGCAEFPRRLDVRG